MLGTEDDAGRPTMLFVSAIVSLVDWNGKLGGNASSLLAERDLWTWDNQLTLSRIDFQPPSADTKHLVRARIDKALVLLSLLEQCWASRVPLVVREESFSLNEILLAERLAPFAIRPALTIVYRAINPEMPASLLCLARGVSASPRCPCRESIAGMLPYAKTLVQEELLRGKWPARTVQSYLHFAKPIIETTPEPHEENSMRASDRPPPFLMMAALRACLPLVAIIALFFLIIGAVGGWLLKPNPWIGLAAQSVAIPALPYEERLIQIEQVENSTAKLLGREVIALMHEGSGPPKDRRGELVLALSTSRSQTEKLKSLDHEISELGIDATPRIVDQIRTEVVQKLNSPDTNPFDARLRQLGDFVYKLEERNKEVKWWMQEAEKLRTAQGALPQAPVGGSISEFVDQLESEVRNFQNSTSKTGRKATQGEAAGSSLIDVKGEIDDVAATLRRLRNTNLPEIRNRVETLLRALEQPPWSIKPLAIEVFRITEQLEEVDRFLGNPEKEGPEKVAELQRLLSDAASKLDQFQLDTRLSFFPYLLREISKQLKSYQSLLADPQLTSRAQDCIDAFREMKTNYKKSSTPWTKTMTDFEQKIKALENVLKPPGSP
ncbi:MAG: hypothetical protein B6D36_14695 [Planctomycetes bacterium UTPLA1]|nr:MAG: hypothetical protein B6D36_14695 [Planctomycetes bacterium UTPLA1]